MPPKKAARFPVPKTTNGRQALLAAGIAAFEALSKDIEKDPNTQSVPVVAVATKKKPAASPKRPMKQTRKLMKPMK